VRLTVVVIAAALAFAGAGASAAEQSSPFPSGWIVFSADRQQGVVGGMLFRIRTNGTGLRQITKAGTAVEEPAFAPDGKRVAFRRGGIFTVKIDGSGLHRLTKNAEISSPPTLRMANGSPSFATAVCS
jgi:Tol biopolymer transport system component